MDIIHSFSFTLTKHQLNTTKHKTQQLHYKRIEKGLSSILKANMYINIRFLLSYVAIQNIKLITRMEDGLSYIILMEKFVEHILICSVCT